MMRTRLIKVAVFLVFCLGLLPIQARADNIQLVGVGGNNAEGVYTVPYYLTINDSGQIAVMCDDYTHDVSMNETWTATIITNLTSSNYQTTRPGATTANGGYGLDFTHTVSVYAELFWLYAQWQLHPGDANAVNFAAWKILDTTLDISTVSGGLATTYYNDAVNDHKNDSLSAYNYEIITPTNLLSGNGPHGSSPQEYITLVPEPNTLTLLGAAMLGLAVLSRRKKGTALQ